jgi:hypothetical protein
MVFNLPTPKKSELALIVHTGLFFTFSSILVMLSMRASNFIKNYEPVGRLLALFFVLIKPFLI